MQSLESVNISPRVTILSVLKHLNYKTYYALAEFIDNSIDSYLKNVEELSANANYQLKVNIEFDTTNNRIVITDNAAGIKSSDYPRAFRTAEIPPDNSRLSEFGMGMKSAACWFSNRWEVRSTALGEDVERTVSFDIAKIVEDKIEELEVTSKPASSASHYTVITLFEISKKMPIRKGLGKVKRHLASIYRDFIRNGELELTINDTEKLTYSSPKVLKVPFFENPTTEAIEWKQNVDFDFGDDGYGGQLKAKGFVAIMETMSVSNSGFALFRRGRVIEGSADNDEGFRPSKISGSLGSHRYKSLFGELHLEGFKVSHTKDGFQWDDNMEAFLDLLKDELESDNSIPILKQADKYRGRRSTPDLNKASKTVVDNTTKMISPGLKEDVDDIRGKEPDNNDTPVPLPEVKQSYFKTFTLNLNDCDWIVHLEVSYDETINELFQVGEHIIPATPKTSEFRHIGVRLSLVHPFMIEFAGDDANVIEPILRIAVAFGLSEVIARETKCGVTEVRNNMNELLSGSLSKL